MPKYNKKYKTVVIDPPWPIDSATPFKSEWKELPRDLNTRYFQLTIDEIRNFPIDDFAGPSCYLFLWATNSKTRGQPILRLAFDLLNIWGFKYHQMITWVKPRVLTCWSPISTRTEHCLFGYRGKLNQSQIAVMQNAIITNYQTPHSEKPVQFYQLLRRWTPEPRIDIFARQRHYGFDGWGDEYVGEGPLSEWLE